jgi:hypothetical protein
MTTAARVLAVLLSLALATTAAGCGGDGDRSDGDSANSPKIASTDDRGGGADEGADKQRRSSVHRRGGDGGRASAAPSTGSQDGAPSSRKQSPRRPRGDRGSVRPGDFDADRGGSGGKRPSSGGERPSSGSNGSSGGGKPPGNDGNGAGGSGGSSSGGNGSSSGGNGSSSGNGPSGEDTGGDRNRPSGGGNEPTGGNEPQTTNEVQLGVPGLERPCEPEAPELCPGTRFGPVALASTRTIAFKITSSGENERKIIDIVISGEDPGDFVLALGSCTLNTPIGKKSCTLEVTFSPMAVGLRRARLSLEYKQEDGNEDSTAERLSGHGMPNQSAEG